MSRTTVAHQVGRFGHLFSRWSVDKLLLFVDKWLFVIFFQVLLDLTTEFFLFFQIFVLLVVGLDVVDSATNDHQHSKQLCESEIFTSFASVSEEEKPDDWDYQ